jgi:hypothetical protein
MRFIFNRDNEHVYRTVEAYKERVNRHRTLYTADQADRLGKAASAYHWVDPQILTSTVLANADDSLPMIAGEAAKQMGLAGFTPADRNRKTATSQQRMVDTTDFVQRMTQAAPVPPTSRTTMSKKDQGFWGKVANFTHLAQVVDAVTPDVISNAIGDVVRPSYSALKTTSQWFTGAQNFVPELLSAEIYDAFNLFPSSHSYHSTGNRNLIDTFIKGPLAQTSLIQQALTTGDYVAAKLDKATPDIAWKDVAGDGFFTGGLAKKAQTDAAYKYRQLVGTDPATMKPFTLGRALAQGGADYGVIEEGGTAYNMISGAVDLLTWISLDPTLQGSITKGAFGLGRVYGKMNVGLRSAGAVVELGDVEKAWQNLSEAEKAAAGVAAGTRRTVVPQVVDTWLNKPSTQKLLEPLVATTKDDTATIWRSAFRGDGILSARAVAEAGTHDEVANALREAVNTLDTSVNVNVRNLPSGRFASTSDLGFLIKDSSQRFTHTFDILPESTYIPQDNINLAAQRLDSLMALFNADMPTRNLWINKLVDTHLDGSKASWFKFYSDFEENLLGAQMRAYGFDEEKIRQFTRWRKNTIDMAQRLTTQDLLDGVPTQYLDGDGFGPIRLTQLLSNGAYLFDPTEIKTVLREMGKIEQFAKKVDRIAEQTGSPAVRALMNATGKSVDMGQGLARLYELYQNKLWKVSKVARPTYLFKVLPDETARALMSGTFDHPVSYIASVFDGSWAAKLGVDGQYVADVFGEPINKAILVQDLQMTLDEYRLVEQEIARLTKSGAVADAESLAKMYENELAQIPELESRLNRASAQLEKDQFALHEALIGRKGTKSAARTITGDYDSGVHVKSGLVDLANKDIPAQREYWVRGIGAEAADIHRTEPMRRVANGQLFGSDVLVIDGVKATWSEHYAAGRGLNLSSDEILELWLINGSGKRYLKEFAKGRYIEGPKPTQVQLAADWVRKMNKEVESIAGTNRKMLDVIATGRFNGAKAFEIDASGHAVISTEFKNFIATEFANDPNGKIPKVVRHFRTIFMNHDQGAVQQIGAKIDQAYNWISEGFFKGIYGTASDKLARSPVWRRAYWGRVEEVGYLLSPDDAQTLLENAQKANLARPQFDRVKKVLDLAIADGAGNQTLEALDMNARVFATRYYEDLMMTASKRSRFSQMNTLQMPFFEAYREQARVWLKLLTERPENAHYVDMAVRGLRQPLPWAKDVNGDGQRDGFFFRDPQTGDEVWAVPMTGALASVFSDAPVQNFRIAGKSMTLVSQVIPGVGPIIQYPAAHFIPNTKNWDPISKLIFPTGRPEEQSASPFSITPLWLKRTSPAFAKFAEKGGPIGKMLSEFITAIGGDPQQDDVYKNYYFNVEKALSSKEPPPKNSQELEAFKNKVEDQAMKLYALRGLAGAVLPGQPISVFMAETKQGNVELGVLADELRRFEKEATDLGEPWGTGAMRFLEVYGDNLWGVFGSSSAPGKILGLQPSRDWEDWAVRNEKFVSDFPSIGAYFGPQDGEFDLSVWQRQRRSGLRPFPTPEDWVKDAQNTVASMSYNAVRGQMNVTMQNSVRGKKLLSDYRQFLQETYPYWNPELNGVLSKDRRDEQIRELSNALKESTLSDNPAAVAAKTYMDFRDQKIAEIKAKYPTLKNWQQSAKTEFERRQLTALGDGLAASIPQFTPLWQNVLSNEYLVPEVDK